MMIAFLAASSIGLPSAANCGAMTMAAGLPETRSPGSRSGRRYPIRTAPSSGTVTLRSLPALRAPAKTICQRRTSCPLTIMVWLAFGRQLPSFRLFRSRRLPQTERRPGNCGNKLGSFGGDPLFKTPQLGYPGRCGEFRAGFWYLADFYRFSTRRARAFFQLRDVLDRRSNAGISSPGKAPRSTRSPGGPREASAFTSNSAKERMLVVPRRDANAAIRSKFRFSHGEYTWAARTCVILPDGIESAVRHPPYTHSVSMP